MVWLVIERIKFPVAGGWTHPTMLAFVPALFVLPTPLVPLVAMAVTVLRRAPELARGRVQGALAPMLIADAWYSIGPVLVLVLADAQHFAWSSWPIYVGALMAQFLFDSTASLTWAYVGEGISPRVQLPLLSWLYVTDALLAPLGLLIASVAVVHPLMMLLAISPLALLYMFAQERKERLDETLALSTAYRGTALLLGDVVEADHHYTGMHSRDVVDMSLSVADRLALNPSQRRNVEFAALLHDVGKIHIPKEIINKPGACDLLVHGKIEELVAQISKLPAIAPPPGKSKSVPEQAIGYFTTNAERMRYPAFRAQGMHVGSGIAEAACKTVVTARLKRTGMRWTPQGLDTILPLRTARLNGPLTSSGRLNLSWSLDSYNFFIHTGAPVPPHTCGKMRNTLILDEPFCYWLDEMV